MQKLKFFKPEEQDVKLLFLNQLINTFTGKLNIRSKLFYYKIDKSLKHIIFLTKLSYSEKGLSSFDSFFQDYKQKRESGYIYEIAPYFVSLSRLLHSIYLEAVRILGEKKAKKILKNSFELAKKKYSETPDLTGYIPPETMGLSSSSSSSSSSAFSVSLMDSIIDYLVEDVIEKGEKK